MATFWKCYMIAAITMIILKTFGAVTFSWLAALLPMIVFVGFSLIRRFKK